MAKGSQLGAVPVARFAQRHRRSLVESAEIEEQNPSPELDLTGSTVAEVMPKATSMTGRVESADEGNDAAFSADYGRASAVVVLTNEEEDTDLGPDVNKEKT